MQNESDYVYFWTDMSSTFVPDYGLLFKMLSVVDFIESCPFL